MAVYAQNMDNNALSNDTPIDRYIQSKGQNIVVLAPSNVKQFWVDKPVASRDDSIFILLDFKNESMPLKLQLGNVKRALDCTVEVITETPDVAFTVTNGDSFSKELAVSTEKDILSPYHVLESSPFHLDETTQNSFFLTFRAKGTLNLVIKRVILSFAPNENYLASPVELLLSARNAIAKSGKIRRNDDDPNSFFATGKNTEVLFDTKILLADGALSASVKVRNTGENNATVYCGYALFTENNQQIDNRNNPYKGNNVVSVVSSKANSKKIVVDSFPEWEKGCCLVLDAKEDLSDFPNFTFLEGTVEKITKIDSAHTEILLDQPIKKAIEKGTKIRVQSKPGTSYLCTDSKMLIPGEEVTFTSSLLKNDSFPRFSSAAICRGTYYVVPVILSYSFSSEQNTIEISDFKVVSGEVVQADEDSSGHFPKGKTIGHAKIVRTAAEKKTENQPVPIAVSALTPEKAKKANVAAMRYRRNQAVAASFRSFLYKIGFRKNRIDFVFALLPLLFIIDVLPFIRKKYGWKVFEYFPLPRRMRILFSVSLFAFGVLVFVPWSVYFGNNIQFPFIFQDFVNWNLRVLTISIIGASIFLLLIPAIISDYLVAVIAGLGLCVYVQAMFMNRYLGTMDGNEPVWSDHFVFGIINLMIWIAIVWIPVVLRKHVPSSFSNVISAATGVVLFLEVLASASMVFSAGDNVWLRSDKYFVDGTRQFQLSKEKNVVVIVMDALGSENVKKCFETYPETRNIVKDFIWFTDARSNYMHTFPGLTNELTGTYVVAPARNYIEMFEKTWHTSSPKSFYKQVDDAGYDARFFINSQKSIIGPSDCYHEYFSNIEARDITYIINYKRIYKCLCRMSGFSSVPYFCKKFFFYTFSLAKDTVKLFSGKSSEKDFIPSSNDVFLQKMLSSGITTDAGKPILSYHYIIGTHMPWMYDEECNKVKEPFDTPIPTAKGCFFILSEFIRLLKKADIYDNTAILLCSDHGGHGFSTPYDMMFMVKPFHENKTELSLDESKVQSIDIPATILHMISGGNADYSEMDGYPAFSVPNDRVRKVYRLAKNTSFPVFDGWVGLEEGNCLEEYNFTDVKTFKWGTKSESFVRQIPLVLSAKEAKEAEKTEKAKEVQKGK